MGRLLSLIHIEMCIRDSLNIEQHVGHAGVVLELHIVVFQILEDVYKRQVERSHREDQKRFYSCHTFYSLDDFA